MAAPAHVEGDAGEDAGQLAHVVAVVVGEKHPAAVGLPAGHALQVQGPGDLAGLGRLVTEVDEDAPPPGADLRTAPTDLAGPAVDGRLFACAYRFLLRVVNGQRVAFPREIEYMNAV